MPHSTLIRKHRVALKGPCTTPVGKGFRSINVRLRQELDLYASVRPVASLPGLKTPYDNVDLIVVRENTEGLYAGQEHVVVPGVVESLRIVTQVACEAASFATAPSSWLATVVAAASPSATRPTCCLWSEAACSSRPRPPWPTTTRSSNSRRSTSTRSVSSWLSTRRGTTTCWSWRISVGDVLYSDLCAGLVGGLGVVPGANLGTRIALFEAVHGSAPDIAGKGKANPIALLRSAAMLLNHIGQRVPPQRIETSVRKTLAEGRGLTADLGGDVVATATLTEQLVANL